MHGTRMYYSNAAMVNLTQKITITLWDCLRSIAGRGQRRNSMQTLVAIVETNVASNYRQPGKKWRRQAIHGMK